MAQDSNSLINELVEKIHQFLSHQIDTNIGLSETAKESLTVASECIEQAFTIQKKPASSELLNIYRSHKQQQSNLGSAAGQQPSAPTASAPNPAQFIQSLANSILSQATAATASTTPAPASATNTATSTPQTQAETPRVRKKASEAEKLAAESFKNQGNDFMKQDKYEEAFDCYSRAIDIDNNNAIYYSNRAAASMKLGDHQAALRDCREAVEIDSTYSKAYGRMGLAYASLGDHQRAKDAYVKAVELDPSNESYKNNLKIAEDALAGEGSGANRPAVDMQSMLRYMMGNPEVIQSATRFLQDPRGLQNLLGNLGNAAGGSTDQPSTASNGQQPSENAASRQAPGTQTSENPAPSPDASQTTQSQPGVNPADLFNLTSRLAGAANIDLVGAGQQLLSSIQQNNPELVNNMRRMMDQAFTPPNDSDRNPPPGYS